MRDDDQKIMTKIDHDDAAASLLALGNAGGSANVGHGHGGKTETLTSTGNGVNVNVNVAPSAASSPSQTSALIELARIIAREADKVDAYLVQNNIAVPSFEPDGLADFPHLPEDIQSSRQELVRATTELRDLVVGPTESLRWLAWDHNNSLSLRAVSQFKIAQAIPVGSTASFAEISKAVGVDEMNIRRLLRHAMTNRIFKEVSPGIVGHTAASRIIAETQSMQDWIGFCTEDMWRAAAATVDAIIKFPGSQENTESGFQVAYGTNEPMFATLGKDPIRGKRFGGAMQSLTGGEGYEVKYFVDNYDLEPVNEKAGTFVDIGGSHGFVCVDLARKYGKMNFIVQDLPKMVASAPKLEGDLAQRIEFRGYDFYTPQTVKGADVYYFRWILHNQSDKYAIKVLENLVPALKKGSRIVINDHCLPEPGQESLWDEKIIRTMDLIMLTLINAQERSKEDFEALFRSANPGFRFVGVSRPKGCRMSIIEAVWEGEDFGGAVEQ